LAKYDCAIIGCGARGTHQAEMLQRIPEMELAALCDIDSDKLQEFGKRFGVTARYTDVDAMLADQPPDIAYIMTHPTVRVEPAVKCAHAGVKALTMEKPMALRPSEGDAMAAASAETGCLMAVNHQRRYMPHWQEFRQLLADGCIGEMKFIRAATFSRTLLEMGGHMMDLMLMILQEADPTAVWATSAGAEGFQSPIQHYAPRQTLAQILFPGPLEVLWVHSQDGVNTLGESTCYMHLEFNVWGTEGYAWHTQNEGWGYQRRGMAEPVGGPTSWWDDNEQAQVEFTRAVGKWIEDPAAEHECSLEHSLRGFRTLMGMCKSSLTGQPWEYGTPVADQDIDALQALLEQREG